LTRRCAAASVRRTTLLAAFGLAPVLALAAPRTLCHADEKPFFSCVVGMKTVSLCGEAPAGDIRKLTYRFGRADKVELEFAATSAKGPHFLATEEPVAPQAVIRQVWFAHGEFGYLLHACAGGNCPYGGGLAVLRGQRVVSNARCRQGPDSMDHFAPELIEFGDGNDQSRSHTPLLQIGDDGNPVDKLYPIPQSVFP
jgi:hypothetical protein